MTAHARASKRTGLSKRTSVLARFGELALASDDLDEILTEGCRLVGDALGTDLAKVVEVQPGGRLLLVRAGVGWRSGILGQVRTELDAPTPEGLALRTAAPIVSHDIAREDRFGVLPFVTEHGVRAMVCVPIIGANSQPPYGVLQVDSRELRTFSHADIAFLRTYANMLASAVSRLRANAELRRRAEENARLLRELQHRVKNNLQVMVGLVAVQERRERTAAAKAALRTVGGRVEALRVLHEKLHVAGEVDRVDLGDYLSHLTKGLLRFHQEERGQLRLVLEVVRGVIVSPDVAAPIGLIVNEFITNSLKHALHGRHGTLGVRLERDAGAGDVRLRLWDDGPGLPLRPAEGGSHVSHIGTGMRMIGNLARQIGAASQWGTGEGGKGAGLTLTFRQLVPHE